VLNHWIFGVAKAVFTYETYGQSCAPWSLLRSLLKDVAGHDALYNFLKWFIQKKLGSFTCF